MVVHNPLRLYRQLKEKCISSLEERLKEYEGYFSDDEEFEEVRGLNRCVLDFLDSYAKLSAGAMDDYEVERFYRKTLEMLETAIDTKEYQYEIAHDRLEEIEGDLLEEKALVCDKDSEYYDPTACEQVMDRLEVVEKYKKALQRGEQEDMGVLREAMETCRVAETRKEKVLCIDRVANLVHTRGSFLPLMCGVPLEEFIGEMVYGEYDPDIEGGVRAVAVDVAKDVVEALTCIREFRPDEI